MSSSTWTWSAEHQRHYRLEQKAGGLEYVWYDSQSSQQGSTGSEFYHNVPMSANKYEPGPQAATGRETLGYLPHSVDYTYTSSASASSSGNAYTVPRASSEENMTPAAPDGIRDRLVFKGTPERGWYETLDPDYRVRTRAEEHSFFTRGRVFAMLWSETAGVTPSKRTGTDNTAFTAHPKTQFVRGKFGENIYCSIRRFVIMRVNRDNHFVEACAITTYGNRGVLKPGCNPAEHTIVHLKGTNPQYVPGEYERGMKKNPIMIEPTNSNEQIASLSRLRLGKTFSIECNVKVRDIGKVAREHLTMLQRYHQDERENGFEPDDLGEDLSQGDMTPAPNYQNTASYQIQPSYQPAYNIGSYQTTQSHQPPQSYQSGQGLQNAQSWLLPSGYSSSSGYNVTPGYAPHQ